MSRPAVGLRQSWLTIRRFLRPTRIKVALLLPGIAFVLLELILEPAAVLAAAPGLLIWACILYLAASLAVEVRRRGGRATAFRALLFSGLILAALDQFVKGLVLQWMPLGQALPLIPGALGLRHAHNVRGSWLAVELGLDFISRPLLIVVTLLFAGLSISLYRYCASQSGRSSLWAGVAMAGFLAAMLSAFVDLAFRGFTVDFIDVAGLVVADFKDVYLDVGIAALSAEIAENFSAARQISNRDTVKHVRNALQLSAREVREFLS